MQRGRYASTARRRRVHGVIRPCDGCDDAGGDAVVARVVGRVLRACFDLVLHVEACGRW